MIVEGCGIGLSRYASNKCTQAARFADGMLLDRRNTHFFSGTDVFLGESARLAYAGMVPIIGHKLPYLDGTVGDAR